MSRSCPTVALQEGGAMGTSDSDGANDDGALGKDGVLLGLDDHTCFGVRDGASGMISRVGSEVPEAEV